MAARKEHGSSLTQNNRNWKYDQTMFEKTSYEATHLSTQQTNRNAKGFPINGTYANANERTIEVPISIIRYADDATECSSLEYGHKTAMIT